MHRSRSLALGMCALAIPLWGCPGPTRQEAAPPPNRQFETTPPQVEFTAVRLLEKPRDDSTNAVLAVRFAADRRLGRTVTVTPDSDRVLLHDDGAEPDSAAGDRTFSGFVRVNRAELETFRQRTARGLVETPEVPVFRGRVLAGQISLRERLVADTARVTADRFTRFDLIGFFRRVNSARSLMVRDPAVLTDPTRTFNPCTGAGNPNGKWTFNYLMTQMANQPATGVSPATFVRQWLHQWEVPQSVNGFTIAARPNIQQIIQAWPKLPNGDLDLTRAPFHLIAIVNRVDLRSNATYGGGNAGEGRFVFEAMDAQCRPLRFTVILEYGVPKTFCPAVRAYGKEWLDLGLFTPGSPTYNSRLEHITEQFAVAGANPRKPNGSALNQLRTNEIVLARPWELREFTIDRASHLQAAATVKQTPDAGFNNTQTLANFINANAAGIVANNYTVPASFSGGSFLGAAAPVPSSSTFWDGPGAHPSAQISTPNTRFGFSLNTCSGCHAGETHTEFQHLSTFITGGISGFLTGETVQDPAGEQTSGSPTQRGFNDLQRRAQDLDALVNSPCITQVAFNPLRMVH